MMDTILILFLLAFGCASFTSFFFFCMGDPHHAEVSRQRILSDLGLFLERMWMNKKLEIERQQAIWEGRGFDTWDRVNWWKVLVCPKCFNTWLSIFAFVVAYYLLHLSVEWLLAVPLYLGISSVFADVVARLQPHG